MNRRRPQVIAVAATRRQSAIYPWQALMIATLAGMAAFALVTLLH